MRIALDSLEQQTVALTLFALLGFALRSPVFLMFWRIIRFDLFVTCVELALHTIKSKSEYTILPIVRLKYAESDRIYLARTRCFRRAIIRLIVCCRARAVRGPAPNPFFLPRTRT